MNELFSGNLSRRMDLESWTDWYVHKMQKSMDSTASLPADTLAYLSQVAAEIFAAVKLNKLLETRLNTMIRAGF